MLDSSKQFREPAKPKPRHISDKSIEYQEARESESHILWPDEQVFGSEALSISRSIETHLSIQAEGKWHRPEDEKLSLASVRLSKNELLGAVASVKKTLLEKGADPKTRHAFLLFFKDVADDKEVRERKLR